MNRSPFSFGARKLARGLCFLVALGSTDASAQSWTYCDAHNEEVFLIVLDPLATVYVTATNDEGDVVGPDTVTAFRNVRGYGVCDWVAETNTPTTTTRDSIANLSENRIWTLEFFVEDTSPGGSEEQAEPVTLRYTYFACGTHSDLSTYGFFCPSEALRGGFGNGDVYFIYEGGGAMHVVPAPIRGQFGPHAGVPGGPPTGVGEAITNVTGSGTYLLPYDLDAVCARVTCTSLTLDWSVFLTTQSGSPLTPRGRTYTFADTPGANRDVTLNLEEALTWDFEPGGGARFHDGQKLVVDGTGGRLLVDEALLTAVSSTLGWGGVRVNGGASVGFTGVTVERAAVGADVYSAGNTFAGSFFDGNGIGIRANYPASECTACQPARSGFDLTNSCVTDSEYDGDEGREGTGIWARGANVRVAGSTVSGNGAYGIRLEDTDLYAYDLLLTANGADNPLFKDGARVLSAGDLTLASYFGQESWLVPDVNSVRDNARDEISIADEGYATVGKPCVGGACPVGNRVSQTGFTSGPPYLIRNEPSATTIPARRVYWATSLPDPPNSAFFRPALVNDANPLSSDPAPNAGRAGGCNSGGSEQRSSGQRGAAGFGGGGASLAGIETVVEDSLGLDPETAALLRAELTALRDALAASPGADSSAALVGALYGLQRLDRDDVLGEHAATMALLTGLHAPLALSLPLPAPLRATAEAALVASVHDRMRREDYDAAGALVALAPEVEDEGARLALSLAAVSLDEVAGDVAGALSRLEAVIAGLGPDEEQLARDLEATAAYLAARLGEVRLAPVGADPAAPLAAAETTELGLTLEPSQPNPFSRQAVIPLRLDTPAEVEVSVYDGLGRQVVLLASGRYEAGRHPLPLDGRALPSGIYLVRAVAILEGGSTRVDTEAITLTR